MPLLCKLDMLLFILDTMLWVRKLLSMLGKCFIIYKWQTAKSYNPTTHHWWLMCTIRISYQSSQYKSSGNNFLLDSVVTYYCGSSKVHLKSNKIYYGQSCALQLLPYFATHMKPFLVYSHSGWEIELTLLAVGWMIDSRALCTHIHIQSMNTQLHVALLKMGRYYNTTMRHYWDMLVK